MACFAFGAPRNPLLTSVASAQNPPVSDPQVLPDRLLHDRLAEVMKQFLAFVHANRKIALSGWCCKYRWASCGTSCLCPVTRSRTP